MQMYNNDEYQYIKYIKKFSTYEVLKYFSKQSVDIYKTTEIGIKFDNVPWYNKKTGHMRGINRFDIAQWNLLEVCFNSIKYSNDYRNKNKQITINDYYGLINETKIMSEKLENVSNFKENDIYKHLLCIANMQFDLESLHIINKFNRLYHIMGVINKDKKYRHDNSVQYIDFREKFIEITGIDYDKYINCFIFICLIALSSDNMNLYDIIENIKFDISRLGFTKEDIYKIVLLQSRDYDFYRKYDNWNILKYYPIVHCEKDNNVYIISNISALLISFSEFMYWIIRNYYKDKKSLKFTNYFGHCFEYYLNELFLTYKVNASKIEEKGNSKVPDWILETDKYIFLIEQKAALFPIDTKSITSSNRLNSIERYLNDNIKKAFVQLNDFYLSTCKIVIRVCLTFERIFFVEPIQDLVLPNITLNSEYYLNWVISINEFEKLISILSNNEAEFNSIIDEKINLEFKKSNNGRGFDTLLDKYENDYIKNKINHYKNITDNYLKILKEIKDYVN